MTSEAKGKILQELSCRMGVTRTGRDYERREYLMETDTFNHRKLKFAMTSYDGPIAQPLTPGDTVTVRFTIEAIEYKGKWYNNVEAYAIGRNEPQP